MSKRFSQFLGTGAGDYHCASHCGCNDDSHCARALKLGGKNIRHAASLFIAPNILVDFSDGIREQMTIYGIGPEQIQHLVVTHAHYDHFYPEKILALTAEMPHALRVYGNTTVRDALDFAARHRWVPAQGKFQLVAASNNYRVKTVVPEKTYTVGGMKVTPVLSSHHIDKEHLVQEEQAFNYVFERGGRTMFYNLDSSYLLPETFAFLKRYRFDIAVFDATFGDLKIDPAVSGHHNFAMLEQTIGEFRAAGMLKENATIVYSHISTHEVPPHDAIAERLAGQGITLAYDGMMLEF